MNVIDPPVSSNSQFGGNGKGNGKRKGKSNGKSNSKINGKGIKNKQRGGGVSSFISGILPDEIVNIGRSVPAAFGHMSDKFNGVISLPSSHVYPTQQQHVIELDRNQVISPVNIKEIYDAANAEVRGI